MPTVADISSWVTNTFPTRYAESWDAVGDVCGRPETDVQAVMLAVDVTPETVSDAIDVGADYLLAHHPLLLGGVTSISPTGHKGDVLHSLIENGIALHVAHTNADVARPGVSDALAQALGIDDLRPLSPRPHSLDKVVAFVPESHAQAVLDELSEAGAGRIGDYDRCAFMTAGTGTFRPLAGSDPYIGELGRIADVAEVRLEMVLPRRARSAVLSALRSAHPYEEPAFDIFELADLPSDIGLGRVGRLAEPQTLAQFAETAALALPTAPAGVRVAGDPERMIRTVAVCGGSGDSLLTDAQQADADVYVTSDLKHHRVSEFVADNGCAVIDVSHYASEFPWCLATAARLEHHLNAVGATVPVTVSRTRTDPWTFRRGAE